MHEGIVKSGQRASLLASTTYRGKPEARVAIFYGLAGGLRRIYDDYRARGLKAIYIDLGYWGRRKKTRWDGFHKMVLNDRHPTAYFQNRKHSAARFRVHGVEIAPWRKAGEHIIVAGMSHKAAAAEGLRASEWERKTITRLRKMTKRQIIYRPKPNWTGARAIPGSIMQCDVPVEMALINCHAVVTHHSNVAVDALLAGVPVFSDEGAASVLSEQRLECIEEPWLPDGRAQFAADLAWTQWSVNEMAAGDAWRYLQREGLI